MEWTASRSLLGCHQDLLQNNRNSAKRKSNGKGLAYRPQGATSAHRLLHRLAVLKPQPGCLGPNPVDRLRRLK